jgi:UDP-sulfoquinovose synthase
MERVIVFGGDGFCGWPTALRLSAAGYDVTVVDNFSRRTIDVELGCDSLTPITTLESRVKRWRKLTGNKLFFKRVDIARNYHGLYDVLNKLKPDTVVHFAEQRAAPYSMKSTAHKLYTVRNNITATHNLLAALVELGLDTHVVHLGTAGVYGYGGGEDFMIPEGYVRAHLHDMNGTVYEREILYPPDPGSIYHMTKTMDAQLFQFYNKNDDLRITDLHQGIVWGTQTEETELHPELVNRFDYDGDYGTVLNRFLMQGAIGHPLTVNGTGGQVRAFINIQDTVRCIQIAIETPPRQGNRVRILNQTAEQLRVRDLAERVAHMTQGTVRYYRNPRREVEDNTLKLENLHFRELGWEPIKLDDDGLANVCVVVHRFKSRAHVDKIITTSTWRKDMCADMEGVDGDGRGTQCADPKAAVA